MIRMNINTLQSVSPMILGPAPYFRLEGSTLRLGPDDRVVATYRRHHWQVEGHHASSYECRDRTRVYFANHDGEQSKLLGPSPHCRVRGRIRALAQLRRFHSVVSDCYFSGLEFGARINNRCTSLPACKNAPTPKGSLCSGSNPSGASPMG
jgi:hypothetical protein